MIANHLRDRVGAIVPDLSDSLGRGRDGTALMCSDGLLTSSDVARVARASVKEMRRCMTRYCADAYDARTWADKAHRAGRDELDRLKQRLTEIRKKFTA